MGTFGQDTSDLTTSDVLKRDVAWDTYLTARLISEKDLQLIRRYDKRGADVQRELLNEASASALKLRDLVPEATSVFLLRIVDAVQPYQALGNPESLRGVQGVRLLSGKRSYQFFASCRPVPRIQKPF